MKALLVLLVALAGCSTLRDDYGRLKPGMSADEVVYLVGDPTRKDSLNVRWAYWPQTGSSVLARQPYFVLTLTPEPDQVLLYIGAWVEPSAEGAELY